MMIAHVDAPNAHAAEDDVVCVVCQDGGSDESDPILFCDGCDVPVHQKCYRVTDVPEGEWLCDPCSKNVNAPKCVYCPNGEGSSAAAMKLVDNGTEQHWACVNCVNYLPELYYPGDDRTARGKVDPARCRLKCSLCAHKDGAKAQCCYKQCPVAFHVKCALDANLAPHKDKLAFYCERHRARSMPTEEEEEEGPNPNQREAAEAESDAETEPMEVEVEAEVEVEEEASEAAAEEEAAAQVEAEETAEEEAAGGEAEVAEAEAEAEVEAETEAEVEAEAEEAAEAEVEAEVEEAGGEAEVAEAETEAEVETEEAAEAEAEAEAEEEAEAEAEAETEAEVEVEVEVEAEAAEAAAEEAAVEEAEAAASEEELATAVAERKRVSKRKRAYGDDDGDSAGDEGDDEADGSPNRKCLLASFGRVGSKVALLALSTTALAAQGSVVGQLAHTSSGRDGEGLMLAAPDLVDSTEPEPSSTWSAVTSAVGTALFGAVTTWLSMAMRPS